MYSSQVLDHFQNPRNAGEVGDADAVVQKENPACGDTVKLSAKVSEGRIIEIRFLAKGCVPAMACASMLTEMAGGRPLTEAAAIHREELIQALGGLPAASGHAASLALDAFKALLAKINSQPRI